MGNLSVLPIFTKAAFLWLVIFFLFGCQGKSGWTGKPHYDGDEFKNVHLYEENTFRDLIKWRWDALFKEIPGPEAYDFPMAENNPDFLKENKQQPTLTWIGHATLLLQVSGKNILTDPVFSDRASPFQWAGPKRVVPPGMKISELPSIDMVLISHDHYDALNEPSILELFKRPAGERTTFYVPLGLKEWFNKRGITRVVEMDWWDRSVNEELILTAVPVQHWSKRAVFSKNQTLWSGWVLESPDFKFIFVGDSGYCPHFKEIGKRFKNFDLAAIPIGAYEPRWFMGKHHMNPEESVKVHQDLRSKKSVAIHWGTFILTDEPLDEPPKRLKKALRNADLDEDEFMVLRHGETIMPESPDESESIQKITSGLR